MPVHVVHPTTHSCVASMPRLHQNCLRMVHAVLLEQRARAEHLSLVEAFLLVGFRRLNRVSEDHR